MSHDPDPVIYRVEHLHEQLAVDPEVAETDVVLEACGEVLVVSAHVPTAQRRDVLLRAVRAAWDGPVTDEIEVLAELGDRKASG